MPDGSAGTAYLIAPDDGAARGVLVLHSWWGVTPGVKELCNRLADEGFVALAPDLSGGFVPETAAVAELELAQSDPNTTAALVLSSVVALRSQTSDPDGPISVVGFSMGASWGLWLATRQPDSIDKVVAYYGTQEIDFSDLAAPVLGHFAEDDELVAEDEVAEMHAHLKLLEHDIEIHRYAGTSHWFAESDQPESHRTFDADAAALAWDRTVAFLKRDAMPPGVT
jgi:carboxymethylenebutenolidase